MGQGHETRLAPTRALVLCPVFRHAAKSGASKAAPSGNRTHTPTRTAQTKLDEAVGLARAINLDIRESIIVPVAKPKPDALFGSGKVGELGDTARAHDADLVIVDHPLSPVQQRNLEKAWNLKVLDRTGLILEIFGDRAQTKEGRLQVELAHLTYQKSRLVRSWTHLERQRGGAGFLGGPGETQIEADRRALQTKIVRLRKALHQVQRTRALHRKGRARVPYATVALVGYTNAGKSTLFNRMTGADVDAKDLLFATLDPTMREIRLPGGTKAIVSDTVGFISNLPTSLIAAFRATLEEVLEADLIVHVRDISSAESEEQCRDVEIVLSELGMEALHREDNMLEVWNKIDLTDDDRRQEFRNAAARTKGRAICVSATTGEGVPQMLELIETQLNRAGTLIEITLRPGDGALKNWLHENTQMLGQTTDDEGRTTCRLRISALKREQLMKRFSESPWTMAAE